MIYIKNFKEGDISFFVPIPKEESNDSTAYVMTLVNKGLNQEFSIEGTCSRVGDFFKIDADFSEFPEGEYDYTFSAEGEIETRGMMRIGELVRSDSFLNQGIKYKTLEL